MERLPPHSAPVCPGMELEPIDAVCPGRDSEPTSEKILAVVVGGRSAPGINECIAAIVIEAEKYNLKVLGFYDGFLNLMNGRTDTGTAIYIKYGVARAAQEQGGCLLRSSRVRPSKQSEVDTIIATLRLWRVNYLVAIGGCHSAFTAMRLSEALKGEIGVAHIPKSIDDDMPLPTALHTMGFETARALGTQIVANIMEDARTAGLRFYIIVSMGHSAGHLASAIGMASGAHLAVIAEEFRNNRVTFYEIVDIVEGFILKRLAQGHENGVALLAEGLVSHMALGHIMEVFGADESVGRDEQSLVRLDDIALGQSVRNELRKRLKKYSTKVSVICKNLGYELRAADPIAQDKELAKDMAYGAVRFLMSGYTGGIMAMDGDHRLSLKKMRDPTTGYTRRVNVDGEGYKTFRKYMTRLCQEDRDNSDLIARMCEISNTTREEFMKRFGYLLDRE